MDVFDHCITTTIIIIIIIIEIVHKVHKYEVCLISKLADIPISDTICYTHQHRPAARTPPYEVL